MLFYLLKINAFSKVLNDNRHQVKVINYFLQLWLMCYIYI